MNVYVWHQIQGYKFATRQVRAHFLVFLLVARWSLTNRRIDTSKWHENSPLNTYVNKSERTLPNDILAHGRGDYRPQLVVSFSSVFAVIPHWNVHVTTLRELTGYTWKSCIIYFLFILFPCKIALDPWLERKIGVGAVHKLALLQGRNVKCSMAVKWRAVGWTMTYGPKCIIGML